MADNKHFAFEDVGDIVFLSRNLNNGIDDQQLQSYQQKRRDIEERSLQSTQRSLGLLIDTEQVGNSTAVELAKQREQLERTNKNIDDIKASLGNSQRHLNSMKSVSRSIFGTRETTVLTNNERKFPINLNDVNDINISTERVKPLTTLSDKYDGNPIPRKCMDRSNQKESCNNPFEKQLQANLMEMSNNLSRLKGLATELGSELDSQNVFLDKMTRKLEDVDINLSHHNKDVSKLLGKK
ncbi:synaptosomal-associated protein 29-like [Musca autumnalis]|uniref:synaptosomal-associated protein 29-like n=1 Tax=Musca autumnalis TaxID=221902 RepID=UPI003CF85954